MFDAVFAAIVEIGEAAFAQGGFAFSQYYAAPTSSAGAMWVLFLFCAAIMDGFLMLFLKKRGRR